MSKLSGFRQNNGDALDALHQWLGFLVLLFVVIIRSVVITSQLLVRTVGLLGGGLAGARGRRGTAKRRL